MFMLSLCSKKFYLIFAPRQYTSNLQGFQENSNMVTRVPQIQNFEEHQSGRVNDSHVPSISVSNKKFDVRLIVIMD